MPQNKHTPSARVEFKFGECCMHSSFVMHLLHVDIETARQLIPSNVTHNRHISDYTLQIDAAIRYVIASSYPRTWAYRVPMACRSQSTNCNVSMC